MTTNNTNNTNTRATINWLGNKRLMAKRIIALFPPHRTYCEVFGGSLAVLMAKEPSHIEAVNDINGDLIRFYLIVKHHADALIAELQFSFSSKCLFDLFLENPGLTDIQKAARWYYLNKRSFGGKSKYFARSRSMLKRFHSGIFADDIKRLSDRLQRCNVDNLPWERCLEKYNGSDTLFFLDPPYTGTAKYAHQRFTADDDLRLAKLLATVKGKYVLTLQDTPENRERYQHCSITGVKRSVRIVNFNSNGRVSLSELIITNDRP